MIPFTDSEPIPLVAATTAYSWVSLAAGAGLVVLGVLLATVRDLIRDARASKRRDQAVLEAVAAEVQSLIALVENNQALTQSDLQLLAQGQRLVNPIDPIVTGVWDLVKVAPPRGVRERRELLSTILDVSRRAGQVNEMIRSRESFRIVNQAHPSFTGQMTTYDHLLMTFQGELLEVLRALARDIEHVR
jgi:hypothetical protein